jgi:putative photosynthetic complex assembly protein 2
LAYALAVLFGLFLWWFLTGAVLYIVGLPKSTHVFSMAAMTAVFVLAVIGLDTSSDDRSPLGAYCAFTCGLLVWAWHEMSFLFGFVTGPRKTPSPQGARGWQRFACASQTLIYHEVAIIATAALLVGLTLDAPNRIGLMTFLVLWVMRLSAKLNIFLGVPNLTEQFLPKCIAYLKSYFVKRPINLLFPLSVTLSTIVTFMLLEKATSPGASSFDIAGYTMLASLMGLAVLEHWLLVLPLPAASLWSWGLKSRRIETFESGLTSVITGR